MTVDEFLSKIQELKNQGKLNGKTKVKTFDRFKEYLYDVCDIEVDEENKLIILI